MGPRWKQYGNRTRLLALVRETVHVHDVIATNFGEDTFMSKTARLYQDTRTAGAGGAMDKLNDELQDVTRIMTKNMEELLWRGDSLDRT